MSVTLRPLNPDTDFAGIAAIRNDVLHENTTADTLHRQHIEAEDGSCCTFVALVNERIMGYGETWCAPWDPVGRFQIRVTVIPAYRKQGIGGALYAELCRYAGTQQAKVLSASVRDNQEADLRFATNRGFTIESHTFESVLDLTTFDGSRFQGAIAKVEATGIRFLSFADTDGGEEAQRKLWELNTLASSGQPGYDIAHARSFAQFAADVFGGYWFRPGGQIIAADADRWIGMAAVGEVKPGEMYNMITTVYPEYRNRGIATALKLLAIRFACSQEARILRTNNRSENAPMLAINRRLGYHPQPGYYTLRRNL